MSGDPVSQSLTDCGCCEIKDLEYSQHYNRPGQDAIGYRLATHSGFLRRMIARLSRDQIHEETEDGEPLPLAERRPLSRLSTRASDDPTIALLDAWAVVADVLTFYQERIANEGFLRTAIERRSVLELARAIGYELKPGVAASAYLAFTADGSTGSPKSVTVAKGTRVQSIPEKGELPQTFETVEEINARPEWNALKPHTVLDTVIDPISKGTTELRLQGTNTGLKAGDAILIVGDARRKTPGSEQWDFRTLQTVTPVPEKGYTLITWEQGLGHDQPPMDPATSKPLVHALRLRASVFGHNAPDWESLDDAIKAEFVPQGIEGVTAIALSPDGRHVACATVDSTIKLWNIRSGNVVQAFAGHKGSVNSIAFSDDGKSILSGGDDGTVRSWDVESGAGTILSGEDPPTHTAAVNCVACSTDGVFALSASADSTVVLWKNRARAPVSNEPVYHHTGAVNGVSFVSDDSVKAISCGNDGKLIFWEWTENETDGVLNGTYSVSATLLEDSENGHIGAVNGVAVSSDGALAASAGSDGTAKLWSIGSGEVVKTFAGINGHGAAVTSVAFSESGDHIVSGSADKTVKLWNADTGALKRSYTEHEASVTGVAYQPGKSDRFLSGSLDKTIKLWDEDENSSKKTLEGPTSDSVSEWPNFEIVADRDNPHVDLDNVYPTILPDSWIVLAQSNYVELYRVTSGQDRQNYDQVGVQLTWRTDFGLEAKITRVFVDAYEHLSWFDLRKTVVFAQSQSLTQFVDQVPRKLPIEGDAVELTTLVLGLESGRAVAVSGRRMRARVADGIPKDALVLRSSDGFSQVDVQEGDVLEVMERPVAYPAGRIEWRHHDGGFIGEIVHANSNGASGIKWFLRDRNGFVGFLHEGDEIAIATEKVLLDPPAEDVEMTSEIAFIAWVGESADRKRTTIGFESALKNLFDYDSVAINANVANATHGETVDGEVLGSGDGSAINQRFKLNHKPLTYVSAPTATGGESTLELRVNDVLWEQVSSLYEAGPRDEVYTVRHDNEGNTFVIHGDGIKGARLPTGQENIKAKYRKGIGPDGEVGIGQLKLLQSKPPGIREVTNPLAATGAAEPESLEDARENAPSTVLTLGRVVSIKDFRDFAAAFSGVGKAQATALWNGEAFFAHVTIATAGGEPVPATSELYRNLVAALDLARDTTVLARVDTYSPRHFNVAAEVVIDSRYLREKVEAEIKSDLLDTFSFARRGFGQAVTEAEIVTVIQDVDGVVGVHVTGLGFHSDGVPATTIDPLPAEKAQWKGNEVSLAELLLINPGPEGVTLKEMPT